MQKNNSALTVAIFQGDIHSFITSHAVKSILFSSSLSPTRHHTTATRHTQKQQQQEVCDVTEVL
jgi:hypothetical protein